MNGLALHPEFFGIELCAGVGMLGEGLRAGLAFLGLDYRTVCYVEREAPAAAQLVALMEAGALDPAPVWSDLVTFNGRRWRGRVDFIVAGFPCQDLSIAGLRAGLDGVRSGLFFNVLDIADACGAQWLFLENVAGIASAGASTLDEAEELTERAASRVLGELADRGWRAEWITLAAADVGAAHGRARWFCLAWRDLGHANSPRRPPPGRRLGQHATNKSEPRCGLVATGRKGGAADIDVGQPHITLLERWRQCSNEEGWEEPPGYAGLAGGAPDRAMANTSSERRKQWRSPNGPHDRPNARADGEFDLFAPGPLDDRWSGLVADHPHLAPATEPGIRMLVNGMACLVDESRNHQLRQIGNGVVALQAAVASVELMRRAARY
ncbi:DNA cytosine methyltransferase [Andreprevotia chitinilytica]|uniref:DNA cytosine methyltransferase n=1 Tax=Andreprevotia chitinilytica TaxID=396808 RepID=UPI00054CE678|nr:DNA cytosine methyltransferase [Andreprevotia chitinilytica]